MTPDDLDRIEARYRLTDDVVDWRSEGDVWETAAAVPDFVAALREAWAERDRMRDGGACDNCQERERNAVIRAEKAERALAVVTTDRDLLLVRAEKAEAALADERAKVDVLCDENDQLRAALDRVRAVLTNWQRLGYASRLIPDIRAAIEGES